MGLHNRSPRELMLRLKDELSVNNFIETGTFKGDTALWAAGHFKRVVTIEASAELFRAARQRLEQTRNIELVHGDTRTVLSDVVASLDGPAIVWDDSHWCNVDHTYGIGIECPLIEEIGIFRSSPFCMYLFIDDARFFMSAPPLPHRVDQWPTITAVMDALTKGADPLHVTIFDDVIIAVGTPGQEVVVRHCQQANTDALVGETRRTRGLRMIGAGLQVLGEQYASRIARFANRLRR